MTNFRFQMRKVATIVACLAVATMFVSCDKGGDDDGNSSGKTDKKLVGDWRLSVFNFSSATTNIYSYHFDADGTLLYLEQMGSSLLSRVDGKYTTSNGRVYLTDLSEYTQKFTMKPQNLAYSIGSDADGEYLSIPQMEFIRIGSNDEPSLPPVKFRRAK